jgi:hypothetical protein
MPIRTTITTAKASKAGIPCLIAPEQFPHREIAYKCEVLATGSTVTPKVLIA